MTAITVSELADIASILADDGNGWALEGLFKAADGGCASISRDGDGQWNWSVYARVGEGNGNISLLARGKAPSAQEAAQAAEDVLFDQELPF